MSHIGLTRPALRKAIPRPEKSTAAQFGTAAGGNYSAIIQLTDNAWVTDEHRALNYLAMLPRDLRKGCRGSREKCP